MDDDAALAGCVGYVLGVLAFLLLAVHIIRCYLTAQWWFLIWGTIIFPAGIIHGGWFLCQQMFFGGVAYSDG